MISASLFVTGIIIGSFLNVLALRFNSGVSILGRSGCSSCGKKLRWFELFPILSFLYLRGRCSKCYTKISYQYPLVELLTGLVFYTVFSLDLSLVQNILNLLVACIFIVIAIYDSRHKIIPDRLVYMSILLALVLRLVSTSSTLDWLAGPLIFVFFASLWLVTRGRAMGFGDSKLGLAIGLLLGATQGFSAIILSFWIGASFGLVIIVSHWLVSLLRPTKKLTIKREIPFAPFMILGAWLALIFKLDFIHASLF